MFLTKWILLALTMVGSGILSSIAQVPEVDLVISNGRVLNVLTGKVKTQSIVINKGMIVAVVDSGKAVKYKAKHTRDADHKLITPGLFDVHFHHETTLNKDTFYMKNPDSVRLYDRILGSTYLPYGVTTVREVGSDESHLKLTLHWMHDKSPDYPDFYPSGAALVSVWPGKETLFGHVGVNNEEEAKEKVLEYYSLGIRHIKLYHKLIALHYIAAFEKATELGMSVCTHIDYKRSHLTLKDVLEIGVKNIEHAYTIGIDALDDIQYDYINSQLFYEHYGNRIQEHGVDGSFFISRMEMFNLMGDDNPYMLENIELMKKHNATLTPTLHFFAQRFGLSDFTTPPTGSFDNTEGLTRQQLKRCQQGYEIMTFYVMKMYQAGIPLNLGIDWRDGGRAVLAEMHLLNQIGIPAEDVFKIATINSARSVNLDEQYGSIEAGKRANLIIFDKDPLDDIKNLYEGRSVIKDGLQYLPPE